MACRFPAASRTVAGSLIENVWSRSVTAFRLMLVCLIATVAIHSGRAAGSRPNVIVVMTDDQGYGEFSCHGNPIARTPNIDRLASESLRLTDFHVAPMCTPTRGQLLTGLDAFRNGAVNVSSGRSLLRPELKTMADMFREAGYRTGIFGKWHLGDNYPFRPEDRGFDEAVWFPSSHISAVPDYWNNDYFDDTYYHNGKREQYEGYCTDIFFDQAKQWITTGSQGSQPFFVYLPLNAAHWPHFVPERYREEVRAVLRDDPELKGLYQGHDFESLISFLAMGANIDENIGELDEFLAAQNLRDDTIFVFLTDNGSTFGPQYYNVGMRGKKTTLWEGGHRVPCFIRWPGGGLGQSREFNDLTQVQDLLPTLADLTGVELTAEELDGTSLAPLFRGDVDALPERTLVINYSRMPVFDVDYTDQNPSIPQRDGAVVMWKHWRLLENERLYDLRSDPHQDHDVAAEHPQVAQKLSDHLDEWWNDVKETAREVQRVVVGNEAENPMMLTACEWLDVFVDQQRQIRRGTRKNGVWHLIVDRPGTYEFELRRWPRESGLQLTDNVPTELMFDGIYPEGEALPIAKGRMQIGDFDATSLPSDDGKSVRFTTMLSTGPTELQTWWLDGSGKEICGAYYVYVERIGETPAAN